MIIAPAITSSTFTNPGYILFNMDPATLEASNIRYVFIPIDQTYTKSLDELRPIPDRVFDLARFGLTDLSIASFERLKATLEADNALLLRYMVLKRGFDPDDPAEYAQAIKYYTESQIITESDTSGG